MTTLDDYVFELNGVQFGLGQDVFCLDGGFDPGSHEIRAQDTPNPVGDTIAFGRDRHTPAAWTWELAVDKDDAEEALDVVETFAEAWLGDESRFTPGAFSTLQYGLPGGRQRLVYGRPRRYTAAPDNRILGGSIPITCDFQRVDMLNYSVDELSESISIIPSTASGLVSAPGLVAPLMASGPGVDRQGNVTVGGRAATWPVIDIDAPDGLVGPYVLSSSGWALRFSNNGGLTMPAGSHLVIDTRPWVRTVLLNGGSAAGYLNAGTDFSLVKLPLGSTQLSFGGIDPAGTATCTVKWREASRSL